MDIPASAPRHADRFSKEKIPRTESFNPDEPGGVSWVKHLPKAVSTSPGGSMVMAEEKT